MTTQTEILAEGRPRTLGQTNSPFEIVREPKDAPLAKRYLRMSGFSIYELSRFCETCPPLFRHLAEAPGPERNGVALGDLPGVEQVELDFPHDVGDAGLAWFPGGEVAGFL